MFSSTSQQQEIEHLLDECVSKISLNSATDLEATRTNAVADNTLNNGISKKQPEPSEADPIERAMGSLGRWHVIVCGFIFLLKFPVAWHQMSIIFTAPNINYTCQNPNVTDKCSAECTSYEFDRETFTETIQMTWNLVCSRQQLANASQTIFMFGILVGNMIFGKMADKYGRRGSLVFAVIVQLVVGIATAFVPYFWLYCVLRFLTAVATGGTMITSFVLVMELVGTRWRDVISVLYQIPFNLGHLTLPLFAYYFRDWHHLQLALSIPSFLLISYYWIIPESPRWLLLSHGRVDSCVNILEKAAKCNKLPTDSIKMDIEKLAATASSAKDQERGNFLDLIRTPVMRSYTLYMGYNWMVCGMCFFGVAQYIGQSDGNIFQNVAISSALELPGTFLSIIAMKFFGRKFTLIISNAVCGVSMLLIVAFPSIRVVLATIALTGMSSSFPTVYLYAGELFPTVVRNVGVGTCSMIARVGSMVAPFVLSLREVNTAFPAIIMGIISLIGAVLALFLPETQGHPLPATIEDAENFGKKSKK